MRLLPLLALLSACAAPYAHGPAFHQAVMRPAPYQPPPAYTPGYAPGTPAEPVYAPVGAGLPGERVPATRAPAAPRSPNKRVLPATGEAGVWAADGDPALSAGTFKTDPLWGVRLSYVADLPETKGVMAKCVAGLRDATKKAGHEEAIAALPVAVRECMAARAIAFCAEVAWRDFVFAQMQYDGRVPGEIANATRGAMGRAKEVAEKSCRKSELGDALWEMLEGNAAALADVTAQWKRAEQNHQPNRFIR